MGNLNAIAFSDAENHLELPSDKDFKKVETMIRELLKPSSTDLPHIVEMAGQLSCRPTKDASSSKVIIKYASPISKDTSHPSGTHPSPSDMPKLAPNK